MPGTIADVKVKVGDKVNAGDGVLIIEAMKMENEIQAAKEGVVIAVHVKKGDSVTPDETLIEIQ
jgi:pyruvate carboxylase subunit B